MKRSVAVALCSLLLILGVAFFCDRVNGQACRQLLHLNQQVVQLTDGGEWTQALAMVRQWRTEWQERKDFLGFFTHHQLTDRVGECLMQMEAALETRNLFEFRMGAAGLETAAQALFEQDAFMLKNVW